ncbi:phthiotriol/phenolphthiotriol dimycocerosates methyltransferase [Mycolicibacterium sediminis]|nr:cytochrome P450 [Mycolicibacterium sediminis]
MTTATVEGVRLPPAPPIPKIIQGIGFLIANSGMFAAMSRRYGEAFTIEMPFLGRAVVISNPALVKELFSTSPGIAQRPASGTGSLGEAFGPGSTFSLAGDELVARRKLLVPPFNGKRMRSYEDIFEAEVMREIATWPEGEEFATLEPMLRLTLGSILRAVFGAEGPILEELRELLPPLVVLAAQVVVAPQVMRRNLGRWSPGGRFLAQRRRFDELVAELIADARADPNLENRSDVLALLLQTRYDDGDVLSDEYIADELLTLVASGHETTASSLAWAIERLCRHPDLLDRLTEEVDQGGSELRAATIREVQRVRPVLDGSMRRVQQRMQLGEWVIPEGTTVVFSIRLAHDSDDNFDDATSFNPDRFLTGSASPAGWIPFGGGINRCIGAAFAHMEMDVVLRILLREFRFSPTTAPDERRHWRGVATAPGRGGRAKVFRRSLQSPEAGSPLMTTTTNTPRIKPLGTTSLFKKAMSKYWYPFLSRRWDAEDVLLINYGYEEDPPMGLPLEPTDEPHRYSVQLYHQTATQVDLTGKKVLEVSCGHGGGSSYVMRTLKPAAYTALDINPDGIAFCRTRHQLPNLDFVHGDAQDLPFEDASYDAILNVEASHGYPDFPRFLKEVERVLRPGGHFLYTDFRGKDEFAEWERALAESPLRVESKRIINPQVLRGLDGNSDRYLKLVNGKLPFVFRPFGRLFAGVPGSLMYRELERGGLSYRIYHFVKD